MTTASRAFQIPDHLNAATPAEYAGRQRDAVRLLILDAADGRTSHSAFSELASYLQAGDVLVLNNSRTIPAVLRGTYGSQDIEIRLSRRISDDEWEALLVDGVLPIGTAILLPGDVTATILGPGNEAPLVILRFSKGGTELYDMLYRFGEPVHYEYIRSQWPLDAYQTVYASVPGSVEMPSAGRAFTWRQLQELQRNGIRLAFLQLHAGLSYYGKDRWPDPRKHIENYHIPEEAARTINEARQQGHRIIAVGTTVVRALETVADDSGHITAAAGVTGLYIQKGVHIKAVDGLITGLHEPEASHLDMLSAFVDEVQLVKAYQEALWQGYLWHEFGDINLILPGSLS